MNRIDILKRRMGRLGKKFDELKTRGMDSKDADEVRAINAQLEDLNADMVDLEDEIRALEAVEKFESAECETKGEERNGGFIGKTYGDKMNTLASFHADEKRADSILASMEYRKAFMDYVQRAIPIPEELRELRSGGDIGATVSTDIGALIPITIMEKVQAKVKKVYGQLYNRVRKINIKGNIKFPISDLKANMKWINESTVSPRQKAGDIKEYIEFSYNIGEIRVSQSLLSSIVTVGAFENEIARIIFEAYYEGTEKVVIHGSGDGQPLGVFNDPRVTNIIDFTEKELADWTQWRKKLFSVIPLSKRGQGEFAFSASTVESYLLTMEDSNGRPLFKEATEITLTDSSLAGRFFGREVILVEPDVISDFDTAESGEYFGMFWVPNDYVVNTQEQFGMKRYYDEDKNEWVTKALFVLDGKMVDTSGCYLLRKK